MKQRIMLVGSTGKAMDSIARSPSRYHSAVRQSPVTLTTVQSIVYVWWMLTQQLVKLISVPVEMATNSVLPSSSVSRRIKSQTVQGKNRKTTVSVGFII